MEKAIKGLLMFIGLLAVPAAVGLLVAFPIKWCWNVTIPEIFGLIEITWGQAWCLNFLATFLIQSSLSHNTDSNT